MKPRKIHSDVPSVLDGQCKEYASRIRQEDREKYCIGKFGNYYVPFLYATNGRPYLKQLATKSGIWELDVRGVNAPKALSGWKSPEGILEELHKDIAEATQNCREQTMLFYRIKMD